MISLNVLEINGRRHSVFSLPSGKSSQEVIVKGDYLCPGSNRLAFILHDTSYISDLVNWNIHADPRELMETLDLSDWFNDRVDGLFKNRYLSPRPGVPTLQIPVQGIGDWCSFRRTAEIDDSGLRARAGEEDSINLVQGIPIRTPGDSGSENILFTSRWNNYPDRVNIPLSGRASHAYLLMTGSVHHMESRMANGLIRIEYAYGAESRLPLIQPDTWWPIEQDYYQDGYAFRISNPRPPRIWLKTGEQPAEEYKVLRKNGTNDIEGGAATVYDLPLDPSRELRSISLETLANDVVIGLMGITLDRGRQ